MSKQSAKSRKSTVKSSVPKSPELFTLERLRELLAETKGMVRGEGDEIGLFTSTDMQRFFPELAPGHIDRLITQWINDEWIAGGVKVKRKNRHGVLQTVWGYRFTSGEGVTV